MWATEQTAETSASPEQIWGLWGDVARWPEWNGDIERIELNGEFAPGSRPSSSSTRRTWARSSSARSIA
jgi:hypothetical protein